ncbi:DsbA family protein [Patescibacteria group bacterium]|nr:DsbA family protein [Patescibacteria group bacterium]
MSLNERIEYLEMKNRHKNKLLPWYKKWWGVVIIIFGLFLLIFIVTAANYIIVQIKDIKGNQASLNQEAEIQKITQAIDGRGENYSLGPINAKVKIVIFSDYACPYCMQAEPVIRSLANQYGDQIRITFRDYPLHMNSIELALAANCAGVQNKFWEMNHLLFNQQDDISKLNEVELSDKLKTMAQELKLNSADFATCLDNKTYLYRLNDDFADAELLGSEGTPTWFINRYKITGYYPEEYFTSIIDGLLAQ